MGSSRLPGKVLMPLGGEPVLKHVIGRARAAGVFDTVVVATTIQAIDDELARAATGWGARVIRGDEDDVLSRYGLAARATGADVIARVTADCPLLDPDVVAAMVRRFGDGGADLVTNARLRTFPRGLDAEVFSRAALEAALAEADRPHQREHVTPFLYEHPERFRIADFTGAADNSHLRWTLDTPEDYDLLQRIFAAAPDPAGLRYEGVLEILAAHPDWSAINAGVEQKKVGEQA